MAGHLVSDLLFNAMAEWLSPVEYDGRALMTLPDTDSRSSSFRTGALLAWEADNAYETLRQAFVRAALTRRFLAGASVRDKMGRFVQYMLRLLVGIAGLTRLADSSNSSMQSLKRMQSVISDARRTYRMLELGPLVELYPTASACVCEEAAPAPRVLALLSRSSAALFSIMDRLRWLQQHRLLTGAASATGRRAYRLLCVTHACNLLRLMLDAASTAEGARRLEGVRAWLAGTGRAGAQLDGGGGGNGANGKKGRPSRAERDELSGLLRSALKQLLCLLQTAHIGQVPGLQTHDVAVGLAGMATSASDLRDMWAKQRT